MTTPTTTVRLPHHNLVAYQVAREFLLAVHHANISDAKLRDEATRAAKSTCLNIAEGAGRVTRADKARAAIELANDLGEVDPNSVQRCTVLASRLVALISGLLRR